MKNTQNTKNKYNNEKNSDFILTNTNNKYNI